MTTGLFRKRSITPQIINAATGIVYGRAGGGVVQVGQVLDAGDDATEQAELVRADFQTRGARGIRIE